jgi:hypothetical protein
MNVDEKLIWLIKPRVFEPDVEISTPMGPYTTSESIARDVEEFFAATEKEYTGVIGGQYSYTFTPTSMGMMLEILDGISGRKINVTDFNSW